MSTTIGFVVYPVSNMQNSVTFYRDVVGLGEPHKQSDNWIEFFLGDSALALTDQGEMVGALPGSQFSIGFEVDDIDATVARLKEHGAKIETEFEGPNCKAAFVHDLDGNRFAIHRLKSKA
jgi:predicted enzyme related to lactoylglutathione lyase